jgi:hypothetical protein
VTPTGSVIFLDGGVQIGNAAVAGDGTATIITSTLAPGSHLISVAYSGDANNNPQTFSGVTVTVNQATPSIAVVFPPTTAVGQPTTLQATVSGGDAPTGTVMFSGNNVTTTAVTLSGGRAQFTCTLPDLGEEDITCAYSGDTNNVAVSTVATIAVTLAIPILLLESSEVEVSSGESITLTALPSGGFAVTGTVTFLMDGTVMGTVPVTNSVASIVTGPLTSGSRIFVANYSGDARNASAQGTLTIQVTIATPNITLTVADTALTAGEGATLTAAITSGYRPSGTVEFFLDGTGFATATLVQGLASVKTPALSHGLHTVQAVYSGDQQNTASSSAVILLSVELAPGVVLNPAYPNRIQLRLGYIQGPLATAAGLSFDPGSDLEVSIDGTLTSIQSFTFDALANRYLMFVASTIPVTSLVQVTYHMPATRFLDSGGNPVPGFSRVGRISDAVDTVIPQVALGAPTSSPANQGVAVVWSASGVAQYELTGTNGYSSGLQPVGIGSGSILISDFTTPGSFTITIAGLDALGQPVFFTTKPVASTVSILITTP